ncbi:MAG: glycosyltransferase family 4 protein [Polyangiales bacterium]
MTARALVHAASPDAWRAPRTLRSLAAVAPSLAAASVEARELADALDAREGPVWLVAAGAFSLRAFEAPPESATGRALCALGAAHGPDGARERRWREALDATGGDLCALDASAWSELPLVSAWLDARAAREVARSLRAGATLAAALAAPTLRRVRLDAFDARFDARARVAQAVTSLQQGGAERVALDLHRARLARGLPARLYALGRPARPTFEAPDGVVDLANARRRGDAAVDDEADDAVRWGADLLHAHLLSAPALKALAARGFAPVVTVHNARAGWPAGTDALGPNDAALLVACSLAAERDLHHANVAPPIRTAWNGVAPAPPRRPRGEVRAALGLGDAPTLVCVANPRPQKRLDRVPAVLAALARLGVDARAVLVGDRDGRTRDAVEAEAALAEAVRMHDVAGRVVRVDSTDDVGSYLAAADVFVSTSAFEGLSLAQIEALALGLPVVATAVGGAPELADGNGGVRLLPEDAPAEAFADSVREALAVCPPSARLERFTVAAMADRYDALYARALRGTRPGRGVWLVTNNFSTGGAQSSARRLLLALRDRGVAVRAATLQEHPAHPTVGRAALLAAGVRVEAIPPPEALPPARAVARLVALLDDDPPQAVLLWNALAEHKLRLADALVGRRVVDVSPGEMYFASLARFFAGWRAGADLPVLHPHDYGRRLRALVVKYAAEAPDAAAVGAPVAVVPNGVPLPERPARGSDGRRVVWGTSVRVSPQKRLELLFEALRRAAQRMPPWELRVAGGAETGSADYAAKLRDDVADLPVTWVGELAEVGDFLDGLDAFVMVAEPAGCPNASLEAMAAGLPVVITDAGGAREQVADWETGAVTPRDDAGALADALVALSCDEGLRRAYGERGRARAAERFSVARMADDYARLCFGE